MSSTKRAVANKPKTGGMGSEFLCKIRYKNPMPSLPFSPKLLALILSKLNDENMQAKTKDSIGGITGNRTLDDMILDEVTECSTQPPTLKSGMYELLMANPNVLELINEQFVLLMAKNQEASEQQSLEQEEDDLPLLSAPQSINMDDEKAGFSMVNTIGANNTHNTTSSSSSSSLVRPQVSWLRRTEYITTATATTATTNQTGLKK